MAFLSIFDTNFIHVLYMMYSKWRTINNSVTKLEFSVKWILDKWDMIVTQQKKCWKLWWMMNIVLILLESTKIMKLF